MRRTAFGRSHASGIGQTAQSPVAPLCAFEDSAGDVPPAPVFVSLDREDLGCPSEGDFHIGERAPQRHSRQLRFRRSPALCKKYSPQIDCVSENAGFFHGLGSLGTRRHCARLFERRQRVGFQVGLGPRGVLFLNHAGLELRQQVPARLFDPRQWNLKNRRQSMIGFFGKDHA
jgi:hypothetical protein